MAESLKQLKHLLRLMKDGNKLYRQAQQRITDRDLQSFFKANIRDRQMIVEQLQRMLDGEESPGGEVDQEARFLIDRASLLAAVQDNAVAVYVGQLADLELETDRAFKAAFTEELSNEMEQHLQHLKFDFDRVHERSRGVQSLAGHRESPTRLPTRMMR